MRADGPEEDKQRVRAAVGRPRDDKIDAAIIQATRELVLETGYPGLSLSAIAARAGTTTAAIYRRWSGKAQLVHEAILPSEDEPIPPSTGDLTEDIRALVEATAAIFDRPEVRSALPALMADTIADQDVHTKMIARFANSLAPFRGRFERRSEATEGDLPMLAEVVVGSAIFRILIRQDAPLDAAWVDDLTNLVSSGWTAVARP